MGRASDPGGGLLDRKPIEQVLAEAETSGFRRALGPIDLTAIGIAAIIGAGIFVLLGQVARGTGPAVIMSLLIGGVAAVLSALTYAELASMIPGSGSAYVYAYAALGRLPAFLIGWFILNAYAVGNMTVAIGWSGLARDGLGALGVHLPAALSKDATQGGFVNLPAALIMVLVTLLCLPRIKESTLVNNLLVGLKLAVVVFVIALGVILVHPSNWHPFSPGGTGSIMTGAAVLFFAYTGFDTVAATAEEAKNPRRDLPLAILLSVGVCALLYMAMGAVVTGMQRASALDADAPVSVAFRTLGYPWAAGIITVGALIALTTVLYAFQLALIRILHSMARDRFLPTRFSHLHPSTGTPWALNLWTGFLTAIGAAVLPLRSVADMTVLAIIYVYVIVAGGVLALKWLRPDAARRFSAHWTVAAAAILLMVVIATTGIGGFIHLVFLAWAGLGLSAYGFYAHRRAIRMPQTTRSDAAG